ncbi:MAG: 16S rRNA (cytosine(1402)-N(4))-methyltransferase RsmH [Elusimicrobiota bacterium]|nr:16S rRNA (cytosine(1402)-N(4))-methyltransferase RsmH [Elusimicrobiota bacterium]
MYHIPVMPSEISELLINKRDGIYVDCTFGGGGHSSYILSKFKDVKIIAFDCDEDAFEQFKSKESVFNKRVKFIRDNFKNIKKNLETLGIQKVDGILADIGVSSKQFDNLSRGFSFDSPNLDMRMDNRQAVTAKEIINTYSQEELADVFYKYGQERKSRTVAEAIIKRCKSGVINSACELKEIICSVKRAEGKINPATKTFQALRIVVNNELDNLRILLESAPEILNTSARIAIISFHSLEDTIVKQNFKENSNKSIYKILTKKIVTASLEEIKTNVRSRSAKLRVAEKI